VTATALILTMENDATAIAVARKLEERGGRAFFFDPGLLPSGARLLYEGGGTGPSRRLLQGPSGELSLDEVTAVWYRRPRPVGSEGPRSKKLHFSNVETHAYYMGLLGSVDCAWLPGRPAAFDRAEFKVEQLFRAERLGFEVPHTLVTNRRRDFADFLHAEQGRVVSKISERHEFQDSHYPLGRLTERVYRRDLTFLHRLPNCATIFQAEVPKAVELRVTVVGRRLFAAEIRSQQTRHSQLDWRRGQDDLQYGHHDLPADQQRRCLDLLAGFGLQYGTIDLILQPDGRYVFLELNPNGQYMWLEVQTGLPISQAIADFLAGDNRADNLAAGAPPPPAGSLPA
jgi:hypothetical protein